MYVGDFRKNKGYPILLEAYSKLDNPPPLVCIGKTWENETYELPPNVHLFEKWPNNAVLAAWQKSLFGVAPSLWPEPFGIVIIEAFAAGKAVVGSNIGGIPEIITNSQDGLLSPAGDSNALAQNLQKLIEDEALRNSLATNAQKRSNDFFVKAVVEKIEAVYYDAIG